MREKPLVLIIDDEEHFLEIMRLPLEAEGFEPILLQSQDGQEVVFRCEELMPDLVVMDIYLSGNPIGIDIALAIKKNPKTESIKIVFWSSTNYALLDSIVNRGAAGKVFSENDFLDKTADLHIIIKKIREILA